VIVTVGNGRFAQHGRTFFGVVEGTEVIELEGSVFDSPARTAVRHALSDVNLMPPCVPSNFYRAGINYAAHAASPRAVLG
jgi:hypothetical protein